ncbi:MAG: hypothetical protein LBL07_03690 [Tannerella sp.]|jgi:hypothetical protein|nr:hypothetical protein [Tannerella sp.]
MKKKSIGKKALGVFLILVVMAVGIALAVWFTKLYINSGARAVIFYGWIPIPFIALPALLPPIFALCVASSIRERFF